MRGTFHVDHQGCEQHQVQQTSPSRAIAAEQTSHDITLTELERYSPSKTVTNAPPHLGSGESQQQAVLQIRDESQQIPMHHW